MKPFLLAFGPRFCGHLTKGRIKWPDTGNRLQPLHDIVFARELQKLAIIQRDPII